MTQRTKAALQTNLNTDLADNTSGDISAADVRGNLIDFTDSVPFLSSATNVVSGSFSGSFQGDGSGLTGISGGSTDTGSLLTTASVSLNTITFTKGDASTFNITVDTGSAGGSTFPYSGSAVITGSLTVAGTTTGGASLPRVKIGLADPATATPGIDIQDDGSGEVQMLVSGSGFRLANQDGFMFFRNEDTNGRIYISNLGTGITSIGGLGQLELYGDTGVTIDATYGGGDLLLSGSAINSTGSWTHANDLTVAGNTTFGNATTDNTAISGSLRLLGGAGTTGSLNPFHLNLYGQDHAYLGGSKTTTLEGLSFTSIAPASVGNIVIQNAVYSTSTKGYTKIDAGNLYLSGSTINSTGSWTHANDLTVAGNTTLGDAITDTTTITGSAGITGSLDIVGDFTVDIPSGASYNSTTGSILVANLEVFGNESALMRGRVNTEIRGESFYDANPALPGNITITNTLGFGSTKGYTKIDAGNVIISGSAVYIKTSSLPTSEPAASGQLWLSGSAGNSKYLMVRD